MTDCFGYIRVSTVKQGEGVSLEAQREAIAGYAAREGITITRWFSEQETAAKRGRPIFESMLQALNRGEANGVVMHKVDRGSRNFGDWYRIGELADAGFAVYFAAESLDFSSRGGRLTADIQAVIAADYIRNLREETRKGITGRLKQGLYPFGAPLGYLDNGGGKPKTVDPIRAPLVRQLFELYASGEHSLRSLTAEINARGLTNRNGRPMQKSGVETILNNPFYCGLIKIGTTGETYHGIHEPLIGVALFEAVQECKLGKCGKKVTKHRHRLRGLFRCAYCDSAMIGERQKGFVYYRCHTAGCLTKCVREEALEAALVGQLSRIQLSEADITRLCHAAAHWNDRYEAKEKDRTDHIRLQLAQIDAKLDGLTDALIEKLIDKETFRSRKERLLLEQAKLKQQETAAERLPSTADLQAFLERIKSLKATYELADDAEKRQLLAWATSNRTVAGKNVLVEPSNWLKVAESALSVCGGALRRPNSRSSQKISDANIVALLGLAAIPVHQDMGLR